MSAAELDEFPLDDDLSFESVLQQQTDIKENLDDLSDFDLDMDLGGGCLAGDPGRRRLPVEPG